MKYDFESIIVRKGKDSLSWDNFPINDLDVKEEEILDPIPMWVADMNFKTCPNVVKEIKKRLSHEIFGYYKPSKEFYDSIIYWQKVRNNIKGLTKENIGYENGVLGALQNAINTFLNKGDSILLNSPTYIGFTRCLKANGYNIVLSEMKKDENGIYRMDYKDMDSKIKENNIKLGIICNPHNPLGRVFSKEELKEALEIYKKNNCIVISDEIWSDVISPGFKHIPTQSVSKDAKDRVIAFYSPTKAFNLAGLNVSYHVCYNEQMNERLINNSQRTFYDDMNVLSMHALIGAYKKSSIKWIDELNEVLHKNTTYFKEALKDYDDIEFNIPEGTYMIYADFTKYLNKHNITIEDILLRGYKNGVIYQDGRPFNKDNTLRINCASPFERIKDAVERIKKYVLID